MSKLTITSIQKAHSIPDTADYLDVAFAITSGEETVYKGRHAFPLDASEKDITRDLKKVLTTFIDDLARSKDNAKVEAIHKQADKTIERLTSLGINAEID
jgi:hypothetical protein